MTIAKTHTGTVITKDGPQVKKLHQTERKEDIELSADVRAGDLLSLTLDGVKDDYTVMTVGGPIIGNTCVPSIIRVKKARK